MPDQSAVAMPFGKHKGCAIREVDSPYLLWCLRACSNLAPGIRCAIRDELIRRGDVPDPVAAQVGVQAGGHGVAPAHGRIVPGADDRQAAFGLLSALLAAGGRATARGEGAVHVRSGEGRALDTALRARLARDHAALDRVAAWVAQDDEGRPRTTPASQLLRRLRLEGIVVRAMPDGEVVLPPGAEGEQDALAALTPAGMLELWFRVAGNMADPTAGSSPLAGLSSSPSNALAGLHALAAGTASPWGAHAAAVVAAVRAGQGVPAHAVRAITMLCWRQAETMWKSGHKAAARRWLGWAKALGCGSRPT